MPEIDVRVAASIATVTLNRPAVRNAVTLQMWRDISRIFGQLGRDPAVRAVLGAGTAQSLMDRAADSEDYAEGRRAFAERRPPRFQGV
ncbi:MAG: hypothetical protein F9K29_01390 [Hyphomicrobiaceae bacterium]|nr:MAG: hypothetical protein F9K29_01390 [Hyphomicrobiaceae bacterium]